MKLNLLATTAVAALVASGGAWAQAQAPGQKQDEKAQMHEQKGAAAKQNRGEEKQAGKERSDQAKGQQHAQDAQQKENAARDQTNAKKEDISKAAEQRQSKQPNAAVDNQKNEPRANERDRRNTASEINKGRDNTKNGSQAAKDQSQAAQNRSAKDRKDQPKAAAQQKTGDQKANQSKQAEQSKPTNQPSSNAADAKGGKTNNQPNSAQNQNTAQKTTPSSNQQQAGATGATQPTNTASAKLSESDRSKVFSTLKSRKSASNQRIDIQVNVGTRLPPRVHPRPLPRTVVEVMPQYRGYEFVTVRDEIAIVRPGTREVVDVIREPGSRSTFASTTTHGGSGTTIHLTDQQRTRLREEAGRFKTSQVSGAGSQCLSLQPVPDSLAKDNPDLKQYQMLAIGDDVVLVDPNQKKIVDVIQ